MARNNVGTGAGVIDGTGKPAFPPTGEILPFGSQHTEKLTPVFQADGVYGVNQAFNATSTGLTTGAAGANSGAITGTNNMLTVATGVTANSYATLNSRRRLRYRPGQGIVGRFAGLFSAPAANSTLLVGLGTAESGYYFGYNGTSFGVVQVTGGVREVQTMTITTPSTATNNYVVTLPNGATVSVTATNNASNTATAYEISLGTFPGWTAEARGNTVIFLSDTAAPITGTFSLAQTGAGTPAVGSTVETTAGVTATYNWVPQASWNGDRLDGTGPSGVTMDKTKGNVFEITMQYLGFGVVNMKVEVATPSAGIEFVTVHTFYNPNTLTTPHQKQPSFPFFMGAFSNGSTTNVSISIGSYAGFVEGDTVNIGPRSSYSLPTAVTSTTTSYVPVFTVKNSLLFSGRPNQCVVKLISVHGAARSNTGLTTFYLIRNAVLTGPTNFTQYDTYSCTYWDTASTGCTVPASSRLFWSGTCSEADSFNFGFDDPEITLQPGETITLAVRSVTATATCLGSLNTREDQ